MGKGKQLKAGGGDADYEKFEGYFYKDATVHGIITTIADSMAEAGIRYTHKDKNLEMQANDLSQDYDLDQMVHSLTEFTLEQLLHASYMALRGERLLFSLSRASLNSKPTSRSMPTSRLCDTWFRGTYLLGKRGASVPQEVIDAVQGAPCGIPTMKGFGTKTLDR